MLRREQRGEEKQIGIWSSALAKANALLSAISAHSTSEKNLNTSNLFQYPHMADEEAGTPRQ